MATIDKPRNIDRAILQPPDELDAPDIPVEELSVQVEEAPTED
jgi:hypothetical protein